MEYTTFYDAGPVITKASFIGFCYSSGKDVCKHKSCGWNEPIIKCPTCGREHKKSDAENRFTYDVTKNEHVKIDKPIPCAPHGGYNPKTGNSACHFDIRKAPVINMKPVKCKMAQYKSFTPTELANPKTEIRYALIEVEFAATYGKHKFIADLKEADFINSEVTLNNSGKDRNVWTAYPGTFSVLINISKIINKKEVIEQIGKVFGQ